MAATSVNVFTIVFPPPQHANDPITIDRVSANESYTNTISSSSLATLSVDDSDSDGVEGLLYVPTIASDDACYNASAAYVPANVTRQSDLPAGGYKHIAIAPWLGSECARKYLVAAQEQPTEGFIFFIPNNSTSAPPNATDTLWTVADKSLETLDYGYSIFAVSGAVGLSLMQASSDYSGNLSTVPHAALLSREYNSADYVRLLVQIYTSGDSTTLPSLWIFLLIVLAVLLSIIGITSLSMHVLQRRRRESLRRRVARGEVDLEALGVKRLTVPQEILDAMPLYTYGTESTAIASKGGSVTRSEKRQLALTRTASYRPTPLQQPTCAICLDDFLVASDDTAGSTVRELPCHHIFHPECVDAFLRDNSSLCPMCKKTSLPQGYCPQLVTNAMVRRERQMRRQRPSVGLRRPVNLTSVADVRARGASDLPTSTQRASTAASRSRTRFSMAQLRRLSGRPPRSPSPSPDRQMTELAPPALDEPINTSGGSESTTSLPPPDEPPPPQGGSTAALAQPVPSSAGRREWARQRALSMLGPRQDRAPLDPDALEAATTPRWRKVVRTLFPGAA